MKLQVLYPFLYFAAISSTFLLLILMPDNIIKYARPMGKLQQIKIH